MIFNIKTDSRRIKNGDTFVALKCYESDGHNYIEDAIKNGAKKIVAEHGNYSVETQIVDNTREYLENELRKRYKECFENVKIIVVTGTNGKTTMAYLMYQALNLLNQKTSYLGTLGFYDITGKKYKLNNTTPDICDVYEALVNSYNDGYKYFVLEASSQGLAHGRLNTFVYDYAVFTNLTHDHLDFHKTMENYAMAKRKVFEDLKSSGLAILNSDDNYCDYYSLEKNNNITYGKNSNDYKLLDYKMSSLGTKFVIEHNKEKYIFSMKLIGKYNIYNILPVIIILKDLGYSFDQIASVTPKLNNGKGRMETVQYKSNMIVVDYAHTPDGLEKIIKTVKQVIKGNIYVIFGVRGNRDRLKRPEMTRIVTSYADMTIITTNHINNEDINQIVSDLVKGAINDKYKVILDRKEAINYGISLLDENDALLILGKGHEDYLNLGNHTIHFDDVEEVNKIIENTVNS